MVIRPCTNLVVDDVEGEHADGVDRLLLAPGAEPVPVARGDPGGEIRI